MNIRELKEQIKDLPDNMPVVFSQNDNPDFGNCEKTEVKQVIYQSEYGYGYIWDLNKGGAKLVNVCVINATE